MRALPHTFRDVRAAAGTEVTLNVTGGGGGVWSLVQEGRWALYRGGSTAPRSTATMDSDTAWRVFTKGISREAALARTEITGDRALGMRVLDTVSIIA